MQSYGSRLAIRLCSLLRNSNTQLPELPSELLWIIVNLTSVKGQQMINMMIANGLVKTVCRFVGVHQPNNINELALTVLSNLAIDQPQARQQINELEKEERPTLSDKLSMIFEGHQTPET